MKHAHLLLITFLALGLGACKKQEAPPVELSDCLQDKFEAFKLETGAESIIKILRPNGTLYWLVDSYADGVEEVIDEQCQLVCIADCECGGNIVFCDDTHLNFPMETLWHQ
jgi:hypothetical protein